MITIENLINNNEWYIEPSEAKDFVKNGNLLSYKICNIELGKIRRWESKEKKVLQLKETINYKFLSNQNSKYVREEYVKYCKEQKNLIDKPNRSPEIFINLYNKILKDGYDIKKGIICINQNNTICIGLHRACIMFFIYGGKFKIPVLKLKLKSSRLDIFIFYFYKIICYIKNLRLKNNEQ